MYLAVNLARRRGGGLERASRESKNNLGTRIDAKTSQPRDNIITRKKKGHEKENDGKWQEQPHVRQQQSWKRKLQSTTYWVCLSSSPPPMQLLGGGHTRTHEEVYAAAGAAVDGGGPVGRAGEEDLGVFGVGLIWTRGSGKWEVKNKATGGTGAAKTGSAATCSVT